MILGSAGIRVTILAGLECPLTLDDEEEIEKAIAAGAKKCRKQKPEQYLMCWGGSA